MLTVKPVKLANLQDCTRLCVGSNLPPGLDSHAAVDMQRSKLAQFRQAGTAGGGALAAYRDAKQVGFLEYYPVEISPTPVAGKDLVIVHCVRIAEPAARSEILGEILKAAEPLWSVRAGACAIGRRKSWEEFGWEVVTQRRPPERGGDPQILFLRKFRPEAEASFLPVTQDFPPVDPGKLRVDIFVSDHCPWNAFVFDRVRKAVASFGRPVQVREIPVRDRAAVEKHGVSSGVAINGKFVPVLRPNVLPDERTIRRLLDEA